MNLNKHFVWFALALATILQSAVVGVPAASASSLLLMADPIRVSKASLLKLRGDGCRLSMKARHSVLEVRDKTGKSVFKQEGDFREHGGGLQIPHCLPATLPNLPESLPPGDYSASWKIDELRSNTVHFTVGTGEPPFLTLEQVEPGRNACMLLHVYIPGPKSFSLCPEVMHIRLFVDKNPYPVWAGCGGSGTGNGNAIDPKDGTSVRITAEGHLARLKGRHTIYATYQGQHSNKLAVNCD